MAGELSEIYEPMADEFDRTRERLSRGPSISLERTPFGPNPREPAEKALRAATAFQSPTPVIRRAETLIGTNDGTADKAHQYEDEERKASNSQNK
jgi:hypothetical protein